jgi:hypothetical protein
MRPLRRLFLAVVLLPFWGSLHGPGEATGAPAPVGKEWVPSRDVLKDVLARVRWGMSVGELRKAFPGRPLSEDRWVLRPGSFRNQLMSSYPNTRVVFEFSGVVDLRGKRHVPVSSSLVGLTILHPVKSHPRTPFVRPPDSAHYRYLKQLHDRYAARLCRGKVDHRDEGLFHPGHGYLFWERCRSERDGELTFVYWSNTRDSGVFAQAPDRAVRADLQRERDAARSRTRDWPRKVCGSDRQW